MGSVRFGFKKTRTDLSSDDLKVFENSDYLENEYKFYKKSKIKAACWNII